MSAEPEGYDSAVVDKGTLRLRANVGPAPSRCLREINCASCTAVAETSLIAAAVLTQTQICSPENIMNQAAVTKSDHPSRALSWKDVKMDYDQVGNVPRYRSHVVG